MTFEIQRTTRTLPGRAAAVRANLDVDTGGQLVAQAVAGLGGSIFDLGKNLYAKEAKIQSDDAESAARLSMVQLIQDIRNEDDVSKWQALYGKHASRVLALTPKNKGGAARYNATIKRLKPAWEEMFGLERERKLEDNMLTASMKKVDGLQRAATPENMAEVIKQIRAELTLRDKLSYSISRSDTQILLADVGRDVQTSAAENLALNRPDELLSMIKGSKIKGFNEITEATEVVRLGNMAQGTINRQLKQQAEAVEAEQEKWRQDALVKALDNSLTLQEILQAPLPVTGPGNKDWWINFIQKESKLLPEPQTDWLVYDKLDREVTRFQQTGLDRDTVFNHILEARADRKLSKTELKELVKSLKPETATESDYWLREARSYIEEQIREKDPLTGLFSDDAAEIALSARGKMALDKVIEDAARADKPIAGRDILIKAHEIAIPLRTEAAKLRKKKTVPKTIGEGLEETAVRITTDEAIDEALRQARENLGPGATAEEIKAEVLRILKE